MRLSSTINWRDIDTDPPPASPYSILVARAEDEGSVAAVFAGMCLNFGNIITFGISGKMKAKDLTHWAEWPEPPSFED